MANISLLIARNYKLVRWDHYTPLPRAFNVTLAVFLIAVLIVGLVGNTTVLLLYSKFKSLQTSSNKFVANQAVSDLIMCVLCLPILIANCLRGHYEPQSEYVLCNIDASVAALTGFVSIWSLAALAFDRCIVIRKNVPAAHSVDKSVTCFSLMFIWLFCIACAAMPLMGIGHYVLEGSNMSCTFDYFTQTSRNIIYNVFIQIAFFGIPVICITLCYSSIYLIVKNHERRYFSLRKRGNVREESMRRIQRNRHFERNELKTAKAALILIVVFCISWLPYSLLSMIALFGNNSWITPIVVTIPVAFAKVSTVLNPVLYALVNKRFKSKLKLCTRRYFRSPQTSGSSDRHDFHINIPGNSRRSFI